MLSWVEWWVTDPARNLWCRIRGHAWINRDPIEWIKECTRCGKLSLYASQYAETVAPPEPEIKDCSCGSDHQEMPMDSVYPGLPPVELVCRVHKKHFPCKRCFAADAAEYWRQNGV